MEIKDFIKKALVDLVISINEANEEIKKLYPECKIGTLTHHNDSPLVKCDDKFYIVRDCDFDISVTVTESSSKEGGMKISVVNAEIDKSNEKTNASRIKMSVPISFLSDSQNIRYKP